LYDPHPFKSAICIDIARESVGRTFDFAFSHERLNLLPDLSTHANDMTVVSKRCRRKR